MEYFAFGETFLEEHSNTDRTPYLFNAKELDEETGLYYYGARYYDAKTSVWQSVDPIMTTYLTGEHNGGVYNSRNLGSYIYCYQSPIVLVDPDGNQVTFTYTLDYKVNYVTGWKKYVPFMNNPTTTVLQTGTVSDYSDNGKPGFNVTLRVPKVYAHNLKTPAYNTFKGTGSSLDDIKWKQEKEIGEVFMEGFNIGWKVGLSEAMMAEMGTIALFKRFNLEKVSTFIGADPKLIKLFLEKKGWKIKANKNGGFKGVNPDNSSDVIHVIQGNAKKLKTNTTIPKVKQGDYLKRPSKDWDRVPLSGNPNG